MVERLLSRFDEAITSADEAARVREGMPAWEVARVMGYTVPG